MVINAEKRLVIKLGIRVIERHNLNLKHSRRTASQNKMVILIGKDVLPINIFVTL
jgi:hypothetical protein